jgi:hypothetical protein
MAMNYDDPDEAARQQMAENLAKTAESTQAIQELEAPDVATINRLAPEKYTIRPELAEYISRMREGVNERAADEKYRNETWDIFDKLGDIRANTYGLKNVHIGTPDTTAQTEAANVNKLTQATELGDIARHGKLRDDLALALARKRGSVGDSKLFLRESSGYTTTSGKPVLVHNDPNTGISKFFDMDRNPLNENDVVKSSLYNQREAQRIGDENKERDNAAKIGEDLSEFSNQNTTFDKIDDILRRQTGGKITRLEDVEINKGNFITGPGINSPSGEDIDLPGATLPVVGRVDVKREGEHSELQGAIKQLLSAYQKTISGLTASDSEAKTIRDSLEQGKYTSEGQMLRGMKDLKTKILKYKEDKLNQYGLGARNRYLEGQRFITQAQANAIPNPPAQANAVPNPPAQEQKPREEIRVAPNGRKAVFNPDTKEFLRYAD